jgi:hypothetical protein
MKTEYCDVRYLNAWLLGLVGSDRLVCDWWETANKAFSGRKPYEVYLFEAGGQRKVAEYILECVGGGW